MPEWRAIVSWCHCIDRKVLLKWELPIFWEVYAERTSKLFLIFPLHPCSVANDFNHIWFWEEFSLRMPWFWPNIVSFAPPSLEVGSKFWDTDSQIVFMSWKGHFARCSGPGYICSLTAFWQCLVKIWGKFSIFRNWYYNDSNGCLSGPYNINVDRPCSRAFQYSFLF